MWLLFTRPIVPALVDEGLKAGVAGVGAAVYRLLPRTDIGIAGDSPYIALRRPMAISVRVVGAGS